MGDADLWGYGDNEPEPDHFSDSSDDDRKRRLDADIADLLPEKKRRQLQKLGYGGSKRSGRLASKNAAAGLAGAGEVVQLDSDGEDIDRQLLKEAQARQGGTSVAAAAAFAAAGQPLRGGAGAGAPRAAVPPPVDSRCLEMLATAQSLQKKLAAAQEEDLLSSDDGEEALDPSPVVVRGAAGGRLPPPQQRQRQRQQQQQEQVDLAGADSSPDSRPYADASEATPGRGGGGGGAALPPLAPAQAAAAAAGADDGGKVPLRLRSARCGDKLLRMRKGDTFDKLFAAYKRWAVEAGHLPSADAAVRFVFDGDTLQPGETPAGLDLEGDECIDVYF